MVNGQDVFIGDLTTKIKTLVIRYETDKARTFPTLQIEN